MKLSVIDEEKSEEVVPRIPEYANTQNRVNAADFFANHPFHVRMEGFSRRLWAPAQQGAQRETKWFYERARGQYPDAQSKLTDSEKTRFQAEYPKSQMFTKTDLAKFESVWDGYAVSVNYGAQRNFANFAERIGKMWEKNSDQFNERYFKRSVARAIIFRRTEKLVTAQPWYNGGYRANVVAYTIAMLAEVCSRRGQAFDFASVWKRQDVTPATVQAIAITAKLVYEDVTRPRIGISNVTEWCKKTACWQDLQEKTDLLMRTLPDLFFAELISVDEVEDEARSAVKTQKMQNGIEAQKAVLNIPADIWGEILSQGQRIRLYSPKEVDILRIASQIPAKIPSEKQSYVLLEILEKARQEAIYQE
jgi:hypothetical protein